MLLNYILTALRTIKRSKTSFFINFSGLLLGFLCCGLIGLHLHHELSYDAVHEKSDRIYRITHNETAGEIPGHRHLATVGPPVGPAFKETFPEVENFVRFRSTPDRIVRVGDKQNYEARIFYVDSTVFNVFTFPFEAGDPRTALNLPNSVVITHEMAVKYFGDRPALDQEIILDNVTPLKVTGVLAPVPGNTTTKFDFLLPFNTFRVPFGYPVTLNDWGWISFHTYILIKPGESAADLETRIHEGIVSKHWTSERAKGFKMELQPLRDIYLGDVKHDQLASGNKTYITVLGFAGLLILLVAGFNFANLFAAISTSRAKEMGVRKVIGAKNAGVVLQLIGESVSTSVAAGITAILLMPFVQGYFPGNVSISGAKPEVYVAFVFLLIGVSVVTGLLAGIYPSLLMGNFSHLKLIKGSFKMGTTGVTIRKGLVFAQFSISIFLVSAVMIISSQIDFLLTKDLGYAKDELLILRMDGDRINRNFPSLKTSLMRDPDITNVSIGGGRMDGDNGNVPIYSDQFPDGIAMAIDAVTFDFFKTIGVDLVAGREFTETQPADTTDGVIINEAAMKQLGWTVEDAIGKRIRIGQFPGDRRVIGVLPDFHFGTLHDAITPLVISYPRTHLQDIYVRFSTNDPAGLVASIEEKWKAVVPDLPFDFVFLNDYLTNLYNSEKFFSTLFRFFAIAAVLIACLGLYGLVSQDVVYRTKEIGVRKVLGSSVAGISYLILKKFLVLVILANIIAWPVCWYALSQWLNEFTYHQEINYLIFPLAGFTTAFAALISVVYKTAVAAMANPVKSLRQE
jgi:putative ABC transport system permease protein